jgi:hypothetical protein
VSGPANLVVADVPTPLFLPFGIFPMNEKRKSGIIFLNMDRKQIRDFSFAMEDIISVSAITWILRLPVIFIHAVAGQHMWLLRFIKRYKYSGNIKVTFANYRSAIPETDQYQSSKQFNVNASLSQDSKARPNSRFSASVAFGTSAFNQLFASSYNSSYLDNTYQSSISYYHRIPYTPFSFTLAATHSQSTISHLVNVSLPNFSFNMDQLYPFRRKEVLGKERWFEKIGLSYNLSALNTVSGIDSTFFKQETLDNVRTGVQHNIPISALSRY